MDSRHGRPHRRTSFTGSRMRPDSGNTFTQHDRPNGLTTSAGRPDGGQRQNRELTAMSTAAGNRIPVILTSHALQSLRDSGYSLPAALGEVVDNSLEANANNIIVQLD